MGEEVAERSPDGRYLRYGKVLGTGSFKTVYQAFDTEDALEVAWNKLQVDRLSDKELENVNREVDLLKKVQHKNIIRFHSSWSSTAEDGRPTLDFITELMMSGNLRQYLKKAKAIKVKVLRRWCCNILEAIAYLHSQDPPIMHRDIKCDNVFINGHVGEVKIGDLGLSAVKEREKAVSVIGTPEFMAPELYEESYTEKLDIYAFGMCMLELVTMEYPYSECSNPAQIFKKVHNGEKPKALDDLVDGQVKDVISACISREAQRPSAAELLQHPLFRDWESDDGRLSNLSLVHGTPENEQLEEAMKDDRTSIGDWKIGVGMIDLSDNLHRPMLISKQPAPDDASQELEVEALHNEGEIRVVLQIPIHDAMKRVEFVYDPQRDSTPQIAREFLQEFSLPSSELDTLQRSIDKQVKKALRQRQQFVNKYGGNQLANDAEAKQTREERQHEAEGHQPQYSAQIQREADRAPNGHLRESSKVREGQANMQPHTNGNTVQENAQSATKRSGGKRPVVVVQRPGVSRGRRAAVEIATDSKRRMELSSSQSQKSAEDFPRSDSQGEVTEFLSALNVRLMELCKEGRYAAVKKLLEKGASPMYVDEDKRTPLHIAAANGRPAISDLLLKANASTEALDRWGKTPLQSARGIDCYEDVLAIFAQYETVDDDAEVAKKNQHGVQLMHCIASGQIDRVREALRGGVWIGYTDEDLRTPLHVACTHGFSDICELLLFNGADPYLADRFGNRPLDNAISNGRKEVLRVLCQFGCELPSHLLDLSRDRDYQSGIDLIEHAAHGYIRAVKKDLQNGANVNFKNIDGRSPLHLACAEGHIVVVEILLKAGANSSVADRWGSLPEEEAACNDHADVAALVYKYRDNARMNGESEPHQSVAPIQHSVTMGAGAPR